MFKDNKKLVAESVFIKEALKYKLSLDEFLLLLYFDNAYDLSFDLNLIKKTLNMTDEAIFVAYGILINKKLISVSAEKNELGKVVEKVSLDAFYNGINEERQQQKKEVEKSDIFGTFENSFGRTLSSYDYEVINAWIEKGFSEDLILAALKEAVYNGVLTIRYIDKILHEWKRKGIKTPEDVKKDLTSEDNVTLLETSVLNFDWLNEKN